MTNDLRNKNTFKKFAKKKKKDKNTVSLKTTNVLVEV